YEILPGPRPGDGQARTEGVVVDHQAVVIPPQSGVYRPRTAADLVLDEEGLLAVVASIGKGEIQRHIGIEVGLVGDRVGEILAHRSEPHIPAGFPLVHTAMPGDRSVQIELAKPAILRCGNWRGFWIGPELRRDVAHHAANVSDHAGGKNPLKRK